MEYRILGRSGLRVSEISLGSWLTYGVGVEEKIGVRCVRAAFDAGINLFDTANVYGRGEAESFLGRALSAIPRDKYVLATKVCGPMSPDDKGLAAGEIQKQLDASLKRLRVDYVDLYQCHGYDEATPLEETMRALIDAVRAGKTRLIGFSNWNPGQVESSFRFKDCERFVSSQPHYSMLWRGPERGLFALCERAGISQIVYSPLAQGLLSGKYRPGQPAPVGSRAASEKMGGSVNRYWMEPAVLAAVERLNPIAARAGLTMSQMALAWVLRQGNVASAIIGASRPEQIAENAAASGKKLSPETLAAIDEALAGVVR